jgi:large subunit ribosomal protein L35
MDDGTGARRSRKAVPESPRPGATGEGLMPKMKTKRGVAKRVKRTGTGKLKRAGGWKQHKLEGKSPKRRRHLRSGKLVANADERRLQTLVPYL